MPIPHQIDTLIYGGSSTAWVAALELKKRGLSVALVTHHTYLLEDLCGPFHFDVSEEENPLGAWKDVLLEGQGLEHLPSLTQWKHRAEKALLDSGIHFLYSSHLGEWKPCEGTRRFQALLITRSGSFEVQFDHLIDGTPRAWLARAHGATLTQSGNEHAIEWRKCGRKDEGLGALEYQESDQGQRAYVSAWKGSLKADGNVWDSWSGLENRARCLAYDQQQLVRASAALELEPDVLSVNQPASSLAELQPEHFGVDEWGGWVAGPRVACRAALGSELHRLEMRLALGERLADVLFAHSQDQDERGGYPKPVSQIPKGELRQVMDARLLGRACAQAKKLEGHVQAVMEVDVLVLGGGTGGAPAGIAAARQGSKTLVVEQCPELGGVGTVGRIATYWFGNRVGFTQEIDEAVNVNFGPEKVRKNGWRTEMKQQWYLSELLKAGGQVWFGCQMAAALVEGNKVLGAIVATPAGCIAVYAKACIDATGSADLAAAAGAQTVGLGEEHLAMQGTGLSPVFPKKSYTNTDYDFIDDNDVRDTTSAFVCARRKYEDQFDVSPLVNSRERRRIVGDVEISPMDIRLNRMFPDTLVKCMSNFDTHGFTVHPTFLVHPPNHAPLFGRVPLRAMLPKGIEGVMVTGLGISAHRDAMPVLRMQGDVQNQGYVAGVAASRCIGGDFRSLDLRSLQRHLVDVGVLESEVLDAVDNLDLSEEHIFEDLLSLNEDFEGLDRLFYLDRDRQWHLLRLARQQQSDDALDLHLALVQGLLGDSEAAPRLREHLKDMTWDDGWNYRGMGQFGRSISAMDGYVMALGRCGGREDASLVGALVQRLPETAEFSHYRAIAEAFESLGFPESAVFLEQLLERNGLTGYHILDVNSRLGQVSEDSTDNAVRNRSLIELHLAKALLQLKPSHAKAREILELYGRDCRGLFARHASEVLKKIKV